MDTTTFNVWNGDHSIPSYETSMIGWRYSMKKNSAILNVKTFSKSGNYQNIYQVISTHFASHGELVLVLDFRGYGMETVKSLFFLFRVLKYFQNTKKDIKVNWISHQSDVREMAGDFSSLYSVNVTLSAA